MHPFLVNTTIWIFIFGNSSTSEDEFDDINKIILYGTPSHTSSVLSKGKFGVVSTDDTKEDSYFIVRSNYSPYTIQVDGSIDGIIISMCAQISNI